MKHLARKCSGCNRVGYTTPKSRSWFRPWTCETCRKKRAVSENLVPEGCERFEDLPVYPDPDPKKAMEVKKTEEGPWARSRCGWCSVYLPGNHRVLCDSCSELADSGMDKILYPEVLAELKEIVKRQSLADEFERRRGVAVPTCNPLEIHVYRTPRR